LPDFCYSIDTNMSEFKSKLLLFDGHALLYRAYHALPSLTNSKGFPTGAIFGFFSMFLKALEDVKPTHVLVTFDVKGPTFRDKLVGDYKAHRKPAPDDLNLQLPRVKEILAALHVPVYEKVGFEADDLLGIISHKTPSDTYNIIATGDMDLLQLITPRIVVYRFKKGFTDVVVYDMDQMKKEFGLTPDQWVDLKALKGDASDNIPGVPGIGEKTALDLIRTYKTLSGVYKEAKKKSTSMKPAVAAKLLAGEHLAELSKKLANIDTSYELEFDFGGTKLQDYDQAKVLDLFSELNIKSLIPKLPKLSTKEVLVVEKLQPKVVKQTSKLITNTEQALLAAYLLNPGLRNYDDRINDDWNILETELKEKKLLSIYTDIELPLIDVLFQMTKFGVRLDLPWLAKLEKELGKQIEKITKEIHDLGGEFNISSPKQLQEVLFERLKIPTENLKKNKKSGGISTAAGELEKMRGLHPIIELIFEYRELTKLKSTYVDALPALADIAGRVHTTYSQTISATGRLSSLNPNLQNIPIRTELGREVRKAFIADKGFKLVSVDYSQIELRIAAALSGDPEMVKIFKSGKDFHTATAARIFNVMESQVDAGQRRDAKTINFSVLYGVSAFGLSSRSAMAHAEASDFIKRYYTVFAGLKKYIDKQISDVHEKGYTKNLIGRLRYYPDINSPIYGVRSAAERQAVNAPMQSLSADIIKMAMVEIAKKITDGDCKMLLQVHDELVFEIKEDRIKDFVPRIVEIMQSVYKLKVPVIAEAKVGDNWNEMQKIASA
jgi:DNA polymerase-1